MMTKENKQPHQQTSLISSSSSRDDRALHVEADTTRFAQQLSPPEVGISSDNKMRIPGTQEEADMAEKALADEMGKLSLVEHDKSIFEVHGLPQVSDEEPVNEDLEAKFSELERELEQRLRFLQQQGKRHAFQKRTKNKNAAAAASTAAIKHVMERYPGYINDKKFRLAFLRSERFDTKLAAGKMVNYFDLKATLFGSNSSSSSSSNNNNNNKEGGIDILGRDVTMADLSKADISILESGMFQLLPIRDAGGRFVLLYRPEVFPGCTERGAKVNNVARAWWYIVNSIVRQNEEYQKRGLVMIWYTIGMSQGFMELGEAFRKGAHVLPQKAVAIHFCYDSKKYRLWAVMLNLFAMNSSERARFRSHFGNFRDAIFKLQTYGIPVTDEHFSSQDNNGSVALPWHREWLTIRKLQERQKLASGNTKSNNETIKDDIENDEGAEVVIIPGKYDVLFGKGKKTKEHIGNIRCNTVCETHLAKYEQASKFAKTAIAEGIITYTHESGGRFLKRSNGIGWQEVEREVAREKISHYFRRLRKSNKASGPVPLSSSPSSSKRVLPPISVFEHQYSQQQQHHHHYSTDMRI